METSFILKSIDLHNDLQGQLSWHPIN